MFTDKKSRVCVTGMMSQLGSDWIKQMNLVEEAMMTEVMTEAMMTKVMSMVSQVMETVMSEVMSMVSKGD
jgi:hypothetical protein